MKTYYYTKTYYYILYITNTMKTESVPKLANHPTERGQEETEVKTWPKGGPKEANSGVLNMCS